MNPDVHTRPIENCYWVVPNRFLAGEYPRNLDEHTSRQKIAALIGAGVKAFIDLTEESEGLLPYAQFLDQYQTTTVTHERLPITDVSVPESKRTTAAILDAIDGHIANGRIVYVHCWGGVGRTGLVVGCWLSRHGYQGDAALARLRELWQQCPKSVSRTSPETFAQQEYVVAWTEP